MSGGEFGEPGDITSVTRIGCGGRAHNAETGKTRKSKLPEKPAVRFIYQHTPVRVSSMAHQRSVAPGP